MSAKGGERVLIQILVSQEAGEWIAHALEFDLMAGGDSAKEAEDEICDMIDAYFEACAERGLSLEEARRPAPDEYFKQFEEVFMDKEHEATFIRRSFEYPAPQPNRKSLALA